MKIEGLQSERKHHLGRARKSLEGKDEKIKLKV